MELTLPALAETQRAFDGVAPTYDRDNAANPLICAMRARTMARLTSLVAPGARLLDLGCGPGTDAVPLARLGYIVTGIDWSPRMVRQAHMAAIDAGVGERVQARALGIHELDKLRTHAFDAAYSNLGAFNCVPDLSLAARALHARLRPGGVLVASVIGRVCPWEIARFALTGDWRRLRVRFAQSFVRVPLEGRFVWTRYYTPAEFAAPFVAAGFHVRSVDALGLFVPPPYLIGWYRRHPRLARRLDQLERLAAGWPGLRRMGDHFLVVLVRN